jgi:bZIP-type transcription factor MBZ1
MSRQMSTSPAASQPGMIDPQFESLIDFSEYDNNYTSPSLSPAATKTPFARPVKAESSTTGTVMPAPQPMTGPSHNYDLYKQQTGIVPGALASTHAVNQSNTQVQGYTSFNIEQYMGMSNPENMFDFNTDPSQGSMTTPDMDHMDFESPPTTDFFFESTVNPNSIGGQEPNGLPSPPVLATQSGPVGRMWPGMHQQAALAKAQAQQRQQQQIIQQQQQAQQHQRAQSMSSQHSQPKQHQRTKSSQPTDPIVEQKITQLLNSMRVKPSSLDGNNAPMMNIPRPRKDEEDMDEDERLLASEEGKKLSSKERRQLRNKVSARAFRSRRKGKSNATMPRWHELNADQLKQSTSPNSRPR